MGIRLLPEMARENAASNRRIAQLVDTEKHELEGLGSSQDNQSADVRRRLLRSARQALRYTLAQVPVTYELWQGILAVFEEGLQVEDAKELIGFARDIVDTWSELLRSTRELWQAAARTDAALEGSDDLDAMERRVAEVRAAVEQTQAFLNRRRQPVDSAVLDAAEAAVAEGRFKTPEAIRSSVRGHSA